MQNILGHLRSLIIGETLFAKGISDNQEKVGTFEARLINVYFFLGYARTEGSNLVSNTLPRRVALKNILLMRNHNFVLNKNTFIEGCYSIKCSRIG